LVQRKTVVRKGEAATLNSRYTRWLYDKNSHERERERERESVPGTSLWELNITFLEAVSFLCLRGCIEKWKQERKFQRELERERERERESPWKAK
jgi:hypothetical protein